MARPSKPFLVLETEGKSHRTKKEMELRKQGENALATGVAWKESAKVKERPAAHKEFLRLKKLFASIDKNDALTQGVINRYCLLHAEIDELEMRRDDFEESLHLLEDQLKQKELTGLEYLKLRSSLQAQFLALDKQVQNKRKMMFDIEKENLMTIASVMRSILKKPAEDEEDDPMGALLMRRQG